MSTDDLVGLLEFDAEELRDIDQQIETYQKFKTEIDAKISNLGITPLPLRLENASLENLLG